MKIAKYESSQGHIAIVYQGKSTARIIGRSGNPLDATYVSSDSNVLSDLAEIGSDTNSGVALLNRATFFDWIAA